MVYPLGVLVTRFGRGSGRNVCGMSTLGSAVPLLCTLGDGAGGGFVGCWVVSIRSRNISANCLIAARCLSPKLGYGVAGVGLVSAAIKSLAALMAASADAVAGMLQCSGKNSTVWPMRSLAVLLT